jgi:hypothetical protein
VTRELGTDHREVKHHDLQNRKMASATRLLFEFLIRTVARSGEAL